MTAPMREAPRPDMRAAAERRAAEIMGGMDFATETGTDKFHVNPADIPDGWTYEWKRRTIYNQEDPAYQVNLARTGWEPVPADRHPDMMPAGGKHKTIERDGQVLMMRPQVITERFKSAELKASRDQVRVKEQQLTNAPPGTFERGTHQNVRPKVSKSYEAMPVPE